MKNFYQKCTLNFTKMRRSKADYRGIKNVTLTICSGSVPFLWGIVCVTSYWPHPCCSELAHTAVLPLSTLGGEMWLGGLLLSSSSGMLGVAASWLPHSHLSLFSISSSSVWANFPHAGKKGMNLDWNLDWGNLLCNMAHHSNSKSFFDVKFPYELAELFLKSKWSWNMKWSVKESVFSDLSARCKSFPANGNALL